ncbi:MAG TPA: hypothetical protein VJY62_19930 [Bacteroidia bacterium]|nr:hypothetical protein [Bacteroidia bacterium]
MKDFALVVHSCDRYEFLYQGFEYFFSRHWDFNIPCEYYFATEEKSTSIKGFNNIKSGKGEWSDRLIFLLTEKIKEEYVLLFQEDMWLNKNVNYNFFEQIFNLTQFNNWPIIKLHSSNIYKTIQTSNFIEGFNIAKVDNLNSDFLMSHQPTLWNKKFLINQLYKNEHPWRNERRGTRRMKKINPEIFHIDYFAENGNSEINKNNNPKGRSEYYAISVNGVLNHNIQLYIQKLQEGNEQQEEYAMELLHHYNSKLTHDGNPKPRKEDIFQKAKGWFREYNGR